MDQFVQEHSDLPMGGIVHNTGAAIRDLLHPPALAIQQFWHSATLRTVLCQIWQGNKNKGTAGSGILRPVSGTQTLVILHAALARP